MIENAAALRVSDGKEMGRLYRAFGSDDSRFVASIACTICACTRSGEATEPNRKDEWCEDDDCICHTEDEDVLRCSTCGSTETTEISDERQSITICAVCGSDEG